MTKIKEVKKGTSKKYKIGERVNVRVFYASKICNRIQDCELQATIKRFNVTGSVDVKLDVSFPTIIPYLLGTKDVIRVAERFISKL